MTTNLKSSKKPEDLHIAVVGDVHLGHPETKTLHILESLRRAFPDTVETGKLDIIFIEGDLFDRLLDNADEDLYEIRIWMTMFLRMCASRDIVLRILEGTPSHDWKQSRLFPHINEIARIGADCKYIDKLSIEHIERFGATVLYVPDEWKPEPSETWKDVQEALKLSGIDKVDYAVMHGYFPHQLPKQLEAGAHDPEKYLSIVRNEIFIGHVHTFTIWKRIVAAGSLDRLNHGEEHDKGHVRRTPEGIKFVINENAKEYVTIDCRGLEPARAHALVEERVKKLRKGAAVRIRANKDEPFATSLPALREKFPDFTWKIKTDAHDIAQRTVDVIDIKANYKIIRIDKDNVMELMEERLRQKYPHHADACLKTLGEVVEEHG